VGRGGGSDPLARAFEQPRAERFLDLAKGGTRSGLAHVQGTRGLVHGSFAKEHLE